jgi:hypothetical protein
MVFVCRALLPNAVLYDPEVFEKSDEIVTIPLDSVMD